MNLGINPVNFSSVAFRAKVFSKFPRSKNTDAFDVFRKSVSEVQAVNSNPVWDENRIAKIFDEVFKDMLHDCPVAKEYGFIKPQLSFEENFGAVASFDVTQNKINISPAYAQNQYMVTAVSRKEGTRLPINVMAMSVFQQNYTSLKLGFRDINVKKLNDEEKELYFRSVLAHELRHWVQGNMLMSTKGCESAFDQNRRIVKTYTDTIKECIDLLQKVDPEGSKEKIQGYRKEIDDFSFILNYKPSKMFESDAKLKYSIVPSDKSYWSVKDHFLPSALSYSNMDKTIYHSSPVEIDAYNYQKEYLVSHSMDEKYKNVSQEFISNYGIALIILCNDDLENMKKAGYPDLLS